MLRSILLATVLSLPAAGLSTTPALAQMMHEQPDTLSLSATGEVSLAPDQAIVTAGAVSRGDTAAAALAANGRLMNGVFAALTRAGVAERDRQTSNLTVNPVYAPFDSRSSTDTQARIIGYEARNTVTAVVRNLDTLGQTIDAMVSSGANELQGVQFAAEDPSAARNEARRRAVAELMALRDLYARAAGFQIVSLHSISESGGYRPQPMMMRSSVASMDESTPIASGELTIAVTVDAVWEIDG